MIITLVPQRRALSLSLIRDGDALIFNGERLDLSAIPDGATLPREAISCDWLASDVERTDGALRLSLILPHGANAPEATRFPVPILDPADGPVALPPYATETPDAD